MILDKGFGGTFSSNDNGPGIFEDFRELQDFLLRLFDFADPDGAFGFHPQEVETAVRNNLKVIFLVCCDKQWGMVKMNQQFALKPVKTIVKKSLPPEETINWIRRKLLGD